MIWLACFGVFFGGALIGSGIGLAIIRVQGRRDR